MNIFICWSGDRSKALAAALDAYLPKFLPDPKLRVFFSENITKGARWFDEVSGELDRADAGIICVTPESLESGWIHFEAGALARAVRGRRGTLYTYLLGVEPAALRGPLGEYQSTRFDRDDTRRLLDSLSAGAGGDAPAARRRRQAAFDANWRWFERQVQAIKPSVHDLIPDLEDIFRRKTFEEPLDECTRRSWVDRFAGSQQTLATLRGYAARMEADGSHLCDLYHDLLGRLDAYAMDMSSFLLVEQKFDFDPNGRLDIPAHVKKACERRRLQIRELVAHLLAPNCGPVLEESRRFARLSTFAQKKSLVIHPREHELQELKEKGRLGRIPEKRLRDCAMSWWEFDRIYFYLVQENTDGPMVELLVESLDQELDRVKARDGAASLIPLHYAVRALKELFSRADGRESAAAKKRRAELDAQKPRLRKLLPKVGDYLTQAGLDKGRQVRDNIKELCDLLGAGRPAVVPIGGRRRAAGGARAPRAAVKQKGRA